MCLQKQLTSMPCVKFSTMPPDNVTLEEAIERCYEIEIDCWSEGPNENGECKPIVEFGIYLDFRSKLIAGGTIELDSPDGMCALKMILDRFRKRSIHAKPA